MTKQHTWLSFSRRSGPSAIDVARREAQARGRHLAAAVNAFPVTSGGAVETGRSRTFSRSGEERARKKRTDPDGLRRLPPGRAQSLLIAATSPPGSARWR
jgi:hypothetical protein